MNGEQFHVYFIFGLFLLFLVFVLFLGRALRAGADVSGIYISLISFPLYLSSLLVIILWLSLLPEIDESVSSLLAHTPVCSLAHMHSAHARSPALSFPQLLLPHFSFSFLLKTHSTRNSRTINNKALVVKTFIAYYVHSYWICIYAMLLCSMRRNFSFRFIPCALRSFRSLSPFVRRRDASTFIHNCKFSNLFSLNYRFVPRLILQFFILSFGMSPLCSLRFAVVSRIVSWIRNESIVKCIRILYKLLLYFRYLFASPSPISPSLSPVSLITFLRDMNLLFYILRLWYILNILC